MYLSMALCWTPRPMVLGSALELLSDLIIASPAMFLFASPTNFFSSVLSPLSPTFSAVVKICKNFAGKLSCTVFEPGWAAAAAKRRRVRRATKEAGCIPQNSGLKPASNLPFILRGRHSLI